MTDAFNFDDSEVVESEVVDEPSPVVIMHVSTATTTRMLPSRFGDRRQIKTSENDNENDDFQFDRKK